MCSLLSAAFVLLLYDGVAMAGQAEVGQVRGGTPVVHSSAGTDSQWDLELLKVALKPPKEEKSERMNPRPKASLPAPPPSPKAEDQGEGSREKTAGKKAHDPNAVWFRQGLAYVANNRYDSAIGAFTLALTADRRDASSYYNRGVLHQRGGQYGAAIEDYTKAARIVPNDADLYYNRGLAYQCSGNLRLAIEDYDRAIQLDPADPWPHWNRGIALSREGREDLASTDFCNSIDLSSTQEPPRR